MDRSEALHAHQSQAQGRGRPRKNWGAIGDITDKVSKGKRKLTRKRLAGQVLEKARELLPPEEIPSESTLYTRLSKLARNRELGD
jgi:AmiR/NasT family two-component response regulator